MKTSGVNIMIGGQAGMGIEKSGRIMTLSFVRSGYYVFANVEHMSQIRGGNNFLRITVDKDRKDAFREELDAIIALDIETIQDHVHEVQEGGAIVYNSERITLPEDFDAKNANMIPMNLKEIALESAGNALMANVVAIGAVCELIGLDLQVVKHVLSKIFGKKGAEIVKANENALEAGANFIKENYKKEFPVKIEKIEAESRMFLLGNEAASIGGIKGGCSFVGEYPMTPSSTFLHFTAKWAEKYGIVVKHTEDELAACISTIGANFAGARAMTGTSGGGIALMSEGISLAAMNEVPLVIFNVMRPGPATGLPTRSSQGDLRQMMHAGQGDALKIVTLPGSAEECFYFGYDAMNLAEVYQMPVIVGIDRYLGESFFTVPEFDETNLKINRGKLLTQEELNKLDEFKRYKFEEDGISNRTIPGMKGGTHRATSDEHDEYGDITEEEENRIKMMEKRFKKLEMALKVTPKPELIGEKDADITFVTWGGATLVCKDAVRLLAEQGVKANVIQIKTAMPFHKKGAAALLKNAKRLVAVEHSYTSQMAGVIAENTGVLIEEHILRYDGRPMTAQFIIEKLEK